MFWQKRFLWQNLFFDYYVREVEHFEFVVFLRYEEKTKRNRINHSKQYFLISRILTSNLLNFRKNILKNSLLHSWRHFRSHTEIRITYNLYLLYLLKLKYVLLTNSFQMEARNKNFATLKLLYINCGKGWRQKPTWQCCQYQH